MVMVWAYVRRYGIRISAGTLAIVTEIYIRFPLYFQESADIHTLIMPRPLASKSLPVHRSYVLPFGAM
jgi:hypothetical protein